jgi:hypothetical protein
MSYLFSTARAATASSSIIGGGLLGAGGSLLSGFNTAATDTNTADLYRQQAQLDLFNAGTKVQANEERAGQTIGAANASAGAAGVTSGGSPTLDNAKTVSDANVADVYTRYTGRIQANSDLYEAQIEDWSAKQAKIAGVAGAGMSVLGTGTTLATL